MRITAKWFVVLVFFISGNYINANSHRHHLSEISLQQEITKQNIYRAYFPSPAIARKTAITFHGQLLESHIEQGYLILELEPGDKNKLAQFGYRFEPATEYIEQRNLRLQSILQSQSFAVEIQSIPGYPCYETVEETFDVVQTFLNDHPTLAEFIDVGDSWEKTQGLGGYDIKVLKLTNSAITGSKPILFINSAIHAREYTTAPLTLEFARWLVNGYGQDADATWLLDHHEIHLMLQANPDGRKQAETGLLWRKNTNQNYCGSTSNNRGADLKSQLFI